MTKKKVPYTIFHKASSIFLISALIWLTASAPFVLASQQELVKQQKMVSTQSTSPDGSDESAGTSNNNLDEKVPNTSNLSEEFLHEYHCNQIYAGVVFLYNNNNLENANDYIAFHSELVVPPPNLIL